MAERQIYSRGTKLSEVPPDFRGISFAEYQRRDLAQQAAEYRKTLPPNEKLAGQKIWQPRDSYGL